MSFVALYLLHLVVPGWLVARSLRLPHHGPLQVIAISYLLLWLPMLCAKLLRLDTGSFVLLLYCTLFAAVLGCSVVLYRRRCHNPDLDFLRPSRWFVPEHGITLAYLACALAYALVAGPYLEIPADALWHIGQIKQQVLLLQDGNAFIQPLDGGGFGKFNDYWYLLVAYIARTSGIDITGLPPALAAVNSVLLLAAVYYFARVVFERADRTAVRVAVTAALAGLFFLLHFGVNVFSYLRYYSFAPALLNYIVLLATIALVMRTLQRERLDVATAVLVPAYLALMSAIHLQEALFAFIIVTLMLAHYAVRTVSWRAGGLRQLLRSHSHTGPMFRLGVLATLSVIAITYLAVHGYAFLRLDRSAALLNHRLVPTSDLLPFLRNLYVLDPTYQFYEVITVWGVLIIALFFLYRREFVSSHYIMASMLTPLTTVFNPAFTDLLLRFTTAEFMWRFCFMLPLHYVAAAVTVTMITTLFGHRPIGPRIAAIAGLLLIIVLLFPLHGRYVDAPYSRLLSLGPVPERNSPAFWSDLFAALDREPRSLLLTDQVTGYVATAMTAAQQAPGYKFFNRPVVSLTGEHYETDDFSGVKGWLLVVNLRDGAPSRTGAISRHWSENILSVSQRYSPKFLQYVESHPALFEKRWSGDRIAVYRIH